MSGFEAGIEAIRTAANAATSAAEQTAGVDLPGSVDRVAAALPGSRTASSAEKLTTRWRNEITFWSDAATAYAGSLNTAADRYAGNEDAAWADLAALQRAMAAAG